MLFIEVCTNANYINNERPHCILSRKTSLRWSVRTEKTTEEGA